MGFWYHQCHLISGDVSDGDPYDDGRYRVCPCGVSALKIMQPREPKSLKSPEMTNKNVLTTAVLGQDGDINIKELNIGISLTTSYSTIPS